MHAYAVLRALLLLPEPKRELSETGKGLLALTNYNFSVTAISIDIVTVAATSIVLRPTALEFRNAGTGRLVMSVAERMAQVMEIWRTAELIVHPLATLVRAPSVSGKFL